ETSKAEVRPLATEPDTGDRSERKWFGTLAALALVVAIGAAFSLMFYNRAKLAADQATAARLHAEEIAIAANDRMEAARKDAASQIELARDAASRAQITSDVLAAPDLVRFNLIGAEAVARASAQLLLSRSRGMIFSGSRLLSPGAGNVYQIWLLT